MLYQAIGDSVPRFCRGSWSSSSSPGRGSGRASPCCACGRPRVGGRPASAERGTGRSSSCCGMGPPATWGVATSLVTLKPGSWSLPAISVFGLCGVASFWVEVVPRALAAQRMDRERCGECRSAREERREQSEEDDHDDLAANPQGWTLGDADWLHSAHGFTSGSAGPGQSCRGKAVDDRCRPLKAGYRRWGRAIPKAPHPGGRLTGMPSAEGTWGRG